MTDPMDPKLNRPNEQVLPEVEGVPAEEGISEEDVIDRLDEDPEEQKNFTETHGQRTQANQPEPDAPDGATGPEDREESIELDDPKYDEA